MSAGVAAGVLLAAHPAAAQQSEEGHGWSVRLSLGASFNFPTRLTIRQEGAPTLATGARWAARPLELPLYYSVRVSRWDATGAWEVELVHHKLYLRNPPTEVQRFEISHGFNLVLVSRGVRAGNLVLRAGAGLVVAHPENVVRGEALAPARTLLGGGYHLAGPALQLGAAREWRGPGPLRLSAEGKVTGAWTRIPVARGWATVPNLALHALAGVGLGP